MQRLMLYIFLVGFFGTSIVVAPHHCFAMGRNESNKCDVWTKTFFRYPIKDQIERFGTFGVEDQYSIFICGNQIIHPPTVYLAEPFAAIGKPAAVFLKEKLGQTKNDLTVRDIVYVFTEMSRQGTYNVTEDGSLMKVIRDAIAGMKDADWKKISSDMIEEINKTR